MDEPLPNPNPINNPEPANPQPAPPQQFQGGARDLGPHTMPLPNERGAPIWDEAGRETVQRFFDQYELLLRRNNVVDDRDKKRGTTIYVPLPVSRRWSSMPEFRDEHTTYEQWRDTVVDYYVGADENHQYTMADYHELMARQYPKGFQNLADYSQFYVEYHPIASYLINQQPPELTQRDAAYNLLRLLNTSQRSAVDGRLAQKVPDKPRAVSYTLAQVHEAISYTIGDSVDFDANPAFERYGSLRPPLTGGHYAAPRAPEPFRGRNPTPRQEPLADDKTITIKTEDLQTLVQTAVQTAMRGRNEPRDRDRRLELQRGPPQVREPPPHQEQQPRFPRDVPRYPQGQQPAPDGGRLYNPPRNEPRERDRNCYYCGHTDCSIGRCPDVETDIRDGLIQRSAQTGQLVLANGQPIPRGRGPIREQVRFYYDRNQPQPPEPPAVAQLMFSVLTASGQRSVRTAEEENEMLRHKINFLEDREKRKRAVFDGVELPARPPKKTTARKPGRTSGPSTRATRVEEVPDEEPLRSAHIEEIPEDQPVPEGAPALRAETPEVVNNPSYVVPVHPYAQVRDASAAGAPKAKDFAYGPNAPRAKSPEATSASEAASRPQPASEHAVGPTGQAPAQPAGRVTAYRNLPPVADKDAEERVWQRNFVNEQSVHLSVSELFSLAPGICKKAHKMTGSKRVAFDVPAIPLSVLSVMMDDPEASEDVLESVQCLEDLSGPPEEAGSTGGIVSLQLRGGDADDDEDEPAPRQRSRSNSLIVGKPSEKLRALFAWVNEAELVECVYDPGSEVVAISADKCYELGIPCDERQKNPMTSANGTKDTTKGLANNVLLELQGGIAIYLQMHVVENAAYDILLGRPFETLMGVSSRNLPDEKHELVVTCPNTDRCLTLRTYARGDSPKTSEPPMGFRPSRI